MVKDEVRLFLQAQDSFSPSQCLELINAMPAAENTVAVFAWCGETVGISFLSRNFKKIFGYQGQTFMEEGIGFIMSRVHPSDLSSFLKYMERLHKPSGTWFENHQENIFEHTYRLKHHSGDWVWVREQLFVLSLTPERLLDKVFITFTDVTEWKKKQEEEKLAVLSVQSKKSKLIEAVVKYKKIQEEKNASATADDLFLTPREKQVLELVSKGYSSKQIAHHLFISRHTVESHRKHLLKKLNVNNAAELVVKANLSSLN